MRRTALGFRNVTLVGPRGEILAYADRAAIGPRTIGLSSATFASSVLPRLLGGRIQRVTLLVAGRPRFRLTGLSLSFPSGEQPLSGGGWACDAAIGTFRHVIPLRSRRKSRA